MLYSAVFPRGYVQLVNRLALGLDIRMGHVASDIVYGPQGVTVVTNQGQFNAPYAIVTLPHGVLRSGVVEFTPQLPAWKQAAIMRLHTGVSDKTYIRFPSVFWNPEPDTLGRIAETSESRWSTWLNFYKYDKIPLLMVFNHDKYALQLESLSDTQVMDAAMHVLRKQYGRGIPDPVGIGRRGGPPIRSPMARSRHVPPGASANDYELMGMPVGPLGFAGDSTTSLYPTLVFGAYLTGQREAAHPWAAWKTEVSRPHRNSRRPQPARLRTASSATSQSPRSGRGGESTAKSRNTDLEPRLDPSQARTHAAPPRLPRAVEPRGRRPTRAITQQGTSTRSLLARRSGPRRRAGAHADHPAAARHGKKP